MHGTLNATNRCVDGWTVETWNYQFNPDESFEYEYWMNLDDIVKYVYRYVGSLYASMKVHILQSHI